LEPSGLRLFVNRLRGIGIDAQELGKTDIQREHAMRASDEALLEQASKHKEGGPANVVCKVEYRHREQWRQGLPSWAAVAISLIALLVSIVSCART
jgi:hypothetical protein